MRLLKRILMWLLPVAILGSAYAIILQPYVTNYPAVTTPTSGDLMLLETSSTWAKAGITVNNMKDYVLSGVAVDNIYTTDGTLEWNRTIDANGNDLAFIWWRSLNFGAANTVGNRGFSVGQSNSSTAYFATTIWYQAVANWLVSTAIWYTVTADWVASFAGWKDTIAGGNYSVVFWNRSSAWWDSSTALGYHAIASGDNSFSAGQETTSPGESSIAIWVMSNAIWDYSTAIWRLNNAEWEESVAIWYSNQASGENAIAIGNQALAFWLRSVAIGSHSHAENILGTAIGGGRSTANYALAIGEQAYAEWDSSVAIWTYIHAYNMWEVALGKNNIWWQTGQIFSVWKGESSNANIISAFTGRFLVEWLAEYGSTWDMGTNDEAFASKYYVDNAILLNTWVTRQDTIDNQMDGGTYIYVDTESIEIEDDGSQFMMQSKGWKDFIFWAEHILSIFFGWWDKEAQILDSRTWTGKVWLEYSDWDIYAFGANSVVPLSYITGLIAAVSPDTIYNSNWTLTEDRVVLGAWHSLSFSWVDWFSVGDDVSAIWENSISMGRRTDANWDNSVALWEIAHANWDNSVAIWTSVDADWTNSVAIGNRAEANWDRSTAMGYDTEANWNYSFVAWSSTEANWHYSVAMGVRTIANWNSSTAIWGYNLWYTDSLFEIGNWTSPSARNNIMTVYHTWLVMSWFAGYNNTGDMWTNDEAFASKYYVDNVAGWGDSIYTADGVLTEDRIVNADGNSLMFSNTSKFKVWDGWFPAWEYSISMGYDTMGNWERAVAIGYNTIASGEDAIAVGRDVVAGWRFSTAMGRLSNAAGGGAVAIWDRAITEWDGGVALGYIATAGWDFATSIGRSTTADWINSIAIGRNSSSAGGASISIGYINSAVWNGATAIGYENVADWWYSTAIGTDNLADWSFSLAMGNQTDAIGVYSTTMGLRTTANGNYSTAVGRDTVANWANSFAMGIFNEWNSTSLFEIGNWVELATSNIMTVAPLWLTMDGYARYGSTWDMGTADEDFASKYYVDTKTQNKLTISSWDVTRQFAINASGNLEVQYLSGSTREIANTFTK